MIDLRCEILADAARAETRIAMLVMVQRLAEEFAGHHDPADVIRTAYRTRENLLHGGVLIDLVRTTGGATRRRLIDSRGFVSQVG